MACRVSSEIIASKSVSCWRLGNWSLLTMISGRRHPPKETIQSVDEKRNMDAGGGGYNDNVKSTSGMWNSSSCSPLRVGD
jgi:hypothetical protein